MEAKEGRYETPKVGRLASSIWSLKSLIEEFDLKVDYAATESNKCLEKFISKEEDAFQVPWTENGWLNPQYDQQELWVRYMIGQVIQNKITMVNLLRWDTSAVYIQERLKGRDAYTGEPLVLSYDVTIRELTGRVLFWENGKPPQKGKRPLFASAVVIVRPKKNE